MKPTRLEIANRLRILAFTMRDIADDMNKHGWTSKAYELCGASDIAKDWSNEIGNQGNKNG